MAENREMPARLTQDIIGQCQLGLHALLIGQRVPRLAKATPWVVTDQIAQRPVECDGLRGLCAGQRAARC